MAAAFSLRLDIAVKENLDKYCNENFISRNKLINKLVKEFLEQLEKDNKNTKEED